MAMLFQVEASHLYPGCTGRMAPGQEQAAAAFGDGSLAAAAWDAAAGVLSVQGYTTAAGTRIAARRWGVRVLPGGRFKVLARLP